LKADGNNAKEMNCIDMQNTSHFHFQYPSVV